MKDMILKRENLDMNLPPTNIMTILIDINTGEIVEFVDKDIEELQVKIAKKLGYNLVDHKLELYGSKKKK